MDIPFWVAIPVVALFVPITAIIMDGMQKMRDREQQHRERLKAMELGVSPLPGPPFLENTQPRPHPAGPGFHGAVWTGIGLGLLVSTLAVGFLARDEDGIARFAHFLMLWAFPALGVGLGLVIYAAVSRRSSNPGA